MYDSLQRYYTPICLSLFLPRTTAGLAWERIRLNMGILEILGECWPLGKGTYQEVGIIAQEVLSLVEGTQQNAILQVPIAPVETLQASVPDNSFDFCDLYDFNFYEALEQMPPIQPYEQYRMNS